MPDDEMVNVRYMVDDVETSIAFYIGLLVCLSAAVNFAMALVNRRDAERDFVELDKLKLVLAVLVPTGIYVATVSWIGIYVSSAIFIAFFMRWLGKYPWWKVAVVSIGNSVVFFLIFEVWFKVPLPKGPLENWLGLG